MSRRPHKHAFTLTQYLPDSPAPLRSSAAQPGPTKPDRAETARRQTIVSVLSGSVTQVFVDERVSRDKSLLLVAFLGVLTAVPCSCGRCLEWRDRDQCLLTFEEVATHKCARKGALPEPSGRSKWWKSVAVEAEGLGDYGFTAVRGETSLDKNTGCPPTSRTRIRPRKLCSRCV